MIRKKKKKKKQISKAQEQFHSNLSNAIVDTDVGN